MRAYMPPGPREGMLLGEPALFPFRHPLGWTPRVRVVDGDRLVGVIASVFQGLESCRGSISDNIDE